MIESERSFDYRTVASLLRFNKNTVQRVFQLMGWQLSRSGRATTATAALEQALIARFGSLGRVDRLFLLRSDNGLVFRSRTYTRMVRSYGLRQEFITPHCP
jgi:putative transposase